MKKYLCGAGAILSGIASGMAQDQRPDIILFMVDDMGWQDTSVPFSGEVTPNNLKYHTPNMERLAREGMMFTQAYASAISSPTRCSLMTGANAARHRVTNWTLGRDESTDTEWEGVVCPPWNVNGIAQTPGIPRTYVARSFVDILRESGYHTIHCGKAHLGAIDTPGEMPAHFGFEVNIAGHAGGGPATYLSENNFGHDDKGRPISKFAIPGLEKYWGTGTFATEALTQEALAALDKAALYAQPYFLYMSHYAVHVPIDRDARYYQKYRDRGLTEKEAAYAALVEGMDKSLGDILDWVDRNGRRDRTVIIFMSDNGGFATHSSVRSGELYTQNAPLRCGKGSLLEGGIREPMIVRWPGVAAPASRHDGYLIIEDFYPTILDMAGAPLPVGQRIDGISFLPQLRGAAQSDPERELIWNYPNVWGNSGPAISLNCSIRRGPWKLIYNYFTGEKELYNIPADISETTNLASSRPEMVQFLSSRLGTRLRSMDAQRPSFAATPTSPSRPCPWPDEPFPRR